MKISGHLWKADNHIKQHSGPEVLQITSYYFNSPKMSLFVFLLEMSASVDQHYKKGIVAAEDI